MAETTDKNSKFQESLDSLDILLKDFKIQENTSAPSSSSTPDKNDSLLQQIIGLLRPLIDAGEEGIGMFVPKILNPNVMSTVRESLLSSNPLSAKRAMYIIKTVVSYLIESKSSAAVRDHLLANENLLATQVLLHLGFKQFKNFWTLFFDIYEILNEKQVHIVQPFVRKLQSLHPELQQYSNVMPWFIILEIKMLRHDNRSVARDGLELFLNSVPRSRNNPNLKSDAHNNSSSRDTGYNENDIFLQSLQTFVLPILREKVYWILNEALDFFTLAEKLGKLVHGVCTCAEEQVSPVLLLLNYLQNSPKEFSSISIYFVLLAAKSCVLEMVKDENNIESSTTNTTSPTLSEYNHNIFIQVLTTASDILIHRLAFCDRLLKNKMQILLLEILSFLQYKTPSSSLVFEFHCSTYTSNREEVFLQFFTFLGGLDRDVFCNYRGLLQAHLLLLSPRSNFFKWILQDQQEYLQQHGEILNAIRSFETKYKLKGFFRWVLLHTESPTPVDEFNIELLSSQLKEYAQQILSESLFSTLSTEEMKTILDFAQSSILIHEDLVQKQNQVTNSNSKSSSTSSIFVPLIQLFFRLSFKSLYDFVKAGHLSISSCSISFNRADPLFSILEITSEYCDNNKTEDNFEFINEARSLVFGRGSKDYTNLSYLVLLKMLALPNLLAFKGNKESGERSESERLEAYNSGEWIFLLLEKCTYNALNLSLYEDELKGQNIEVKHRFVSHVSDLKLWVLAKVVINRDEGIRCGNFNALENKHGILRKTMAAALDLVDSGSHLGLTYVFEILQQILTESFKSNFKDLIQEIGDFADQAWTRTLELHSTPKFWKAFTSLCSFISHPAFTGIGVLSKYSTEIFELSESIPGVISTLTYAIRDKIEQEDFSRPEIRALYDDYLTEVLNVCIDISCSTPGLFKSAKTMYNLWSYLCANETDDKDIATNYDDFLSLPFSGDAKSRIIATLTILKLYKIKKLSDDETSTSEHVVFLNAAIDKLLDMNDNGCADKRRNFNGSFYHRFKHRITQNLLILQPYYTRDIAAKVMRNLLLSLAKDGPLTSVRYFTEWIIIAIIIAHPELQEDFFKTAEECIEMRVGFGAMYATILLHSASNLPFDAESSFFPTALQRMSDLLMNQNFSVRIYGNITLTKLFEMVIKANCESILIRYQAIYNSAKRTVETAAGNFMKIYNNVSNDFYIGSFDPVKHYFLDVIYILLPRITKMPEDEIIHRRDLKSIFTNTHQSYDELQLPPLESQDEIQALYMDGEQYTFHLKCSLIDGREQGEEKSSSLTPEIAPSNDEENSTAANSNILQVKIRPWRYLPASEDLLDFPEQAQVKKQSRKDKLVLVASLIDNIPNLGGLCRTSEIFGVSKYVISSLKYLEDNQFKALSMSSHRWTDILEVPAKGLQEFLRDYSLQGYSIVAIEQASNSVKLHQFQFPEKCVLLLGNEKQGIPAELLHLVDHCVEIPQVGLTRSLNVHVSGSLVLFQYAVQHIL